MSTYDHLKCHFHPYKTFDLSQNPFGIAPLFRDFKEKKICESEESLFVYPQPSDEEAKILLSAADQRMLVYGLYGVGKTSFVDFFLYLAHNFHHRFSTRVVVTQDNLEKAIHEILISLCSDILSEIDRKKLFRPIEAIWKWIAKERYHDTLMSYMQQLMGKYVEVTEEKRTKRKGLSASLGLVKGSYEKEIEIRKSMQNYIEVLPLRKISEYLADLLKIVTFLGFKDILIFVDEADHLSELESFLKLLTRSREVLFTKGYTFFIAGSVEIAKYTEAMGSIFDKLIFIKPATLPAMMDIFDHRIRSINPKKKAKDIFSQEALEEIYNRSKGVRKQALRLAENALERAALEKASKVVVSHLEDVIKTGYDEVVLNLSLSQVNLLKHLARKGATSPSNTDLQKALKLGRTRLRILLEELLQTGYVHKSKRGKVVLYQISSQYQAYFAG